MRGHLRNCNIEIDSAALQNNLDVIRQCAPDSRIMPVIKANAYGHGVQQVMQACEDVDAFAVAMISEALQLRELGCDKPIVVFHGFNDLDELAQVAKHRLQPTIHASWQLDLLQQYQGFPVTVWLKIDTGMHRLGVPMSEVSECFASLQAMETVSQVNVMSHFANADDPENISNSLQLSNLLKVRDDIVVWPSCQFSLANSAAIITRPESHFDWVRPGIMLYGASPLLDRPAAELGLLPAMRFTSVLLDIKQYQAGDTLGYGSAYECPEDMRVGIVAAGYADGYPRHAASGTPVSVNGQRSSLLGRVSMDSIYIDCRNIDASVGDEVELWGREIAVDEVAASAGTIAYELLCKAG